jgi:hypothetical protein
MRPGESQSRIRNLEVQANEQARRMEAPSRFAGQRVRRDGRFKARLTSALAATTDPENPETATARIFYWTGSTFRYANLDAITVLDFMLTEDESCESGTHVWIEFGEDGKWWVVDGGCAAPAWEPEEPA